VFTSRRSSKPVPSVVRNQPSQIDQRYFPNRATINPTSTAIGAIVNVLGIHISKSVKILAIFESAY